MTYDKPIDTPQPVAGVSITDTIRARLAAATPGPWETVPTTGNAVVSPDGDGYWTDVADNIGTEADAALIANAPADLTFLLAEVERLEREKAEAWDEGHERGFWNGRLSQLDVPYGAPHAKETHE